MKYSRLLPADIIRKKSDRIPITMVAAYDAWSAKLVDEVGIDIILVGDSAGNIVAGYPTTLPMTVDHMMYHCQAVNSASNHAMVVADMPFMSYCNDDVAKINAGRFLKESGATAVKMEILPAQIETLKAVTAIGIPVMAHIGFTPQTLFQLGGYKVQGKGETAKQAMVDLAVSIEAAGAFSIVLEMVPADVATAIQSTLTIPTIGIGAGVHCDGQVLVFHDLVGISEKPPKFVRQFGHIREAIITALSQYKHSVLTQEFPGEEHSF
ncbi:3-methyl-2-oxobutanoate hydroxymethyltransferase [bacterium]|nr:3-methyl-2-oxobutanoate hydroxymethyltransferase [bacterium]